MIHGQMLEDGRLLVDNTLLAAEARCQLQSTLRMQLGLETTEERIYLVSGQAIHKALEVRMKGGATKDVLWALEQFYAPKWEALCTPETALAMGMSVDELRKDRCGYENVKVVVGEWLTRNPTLPFEVDPASVEAGFEVLLDPEENIWYTGTPDVGAVEMDGRRYAVEHKSTGAISQPWKRGFRTSGQISGYLWGLEQVHQVPYVGMWVNAIELKTVPSSTRKCTEHGQPYAECGVMHLKSELWPVTRDQAQLEQWKTSSIWLARRYKTRLVSGVALASVPLEGEHNGGCAYCAFEDWCAMGRRPEELNVRYQTKFWDPAARFAAEEGTT